MLAIALLLGLGVQDPVAVAGLSPQEAMAVRGEAELTPAAAFASARTRAEDGARERWQTRVERVMATQRPFWMPAVFADLAVSRWFADLPIERSLKVLDREDAQREHDFGSSYQTTLWVVEDPRVVEAQELRLRRELRRAEYQLLWKSGGIALFWSVLAFGIGWVDRLSRGYMTGRLRLIGLLLGAAIPTVTFLL